MASALNQLLKLFPSFHPPNCPRQFEQSLAVTGMTQIARVGRIERPDDYFWPLGDSGTHHMLGA
jgi:hypothetical protein